MERQGFYTDQELDYVNRLCASFSKIDLHKLQEYGGNGKLLHRDYGYLNTTCSVLSQGDVEYEEITRVHEVLDPRDVSARSDRFCNIPPFPGSMWTQKLNASLILPYTVATQWPTEYTVGTIMSQCFKDKVSVIIALGEVPYMAGLDEEGGTIYWKSRSFPELSLSVRTSAPREDKIFGTLLEHREIVINNERTVHHIWMKSWEDFSGAHVRTFPCVEKLAMILRACHAERKQSLIHCRAGVGRTGTVCFIAACWDALAREGVVCPQQELAKLRLKRCFAVQSFSQYVMAIKLLGSVDVQAPVPSLSELLQVGEEVPDLD